ncbi:adenine phosphoribosyltransferase [bacterium]|nr:adenine phosphoribosyltransferase [bacterium]
MEELKKHIRQIPDYPKEGINFIDITTIIKKGPQFAQIIDLMYDYFKDKPIDAVLGIEARGFILASALAYKMGIGVIPVRKPGKLPAETIKEEYSLEYGTDAVEMHVDALENCKNILVIDDLLATGGTVRAACSLVEKAGGTVQGVGFMVELDFLNGREKIKDYDILSLVHYDSE